MSANASLQKSANERKRTQKSPKLGVSQRPLTLILPQKYRDTNGRRIVIQIGGVYTTFCHREGILLQKYAIEMGGVSRYFSQVSGSGVDSTLLIKINQGSPNNQGKEGQGNAVVLSAVVRRNTRKRAQTQVCKRAQMSAKGSKRAQKSVRIRIETARFGNSQKKRSFGKGVFHSAAMPGECTLTRLSGQSALGIGKVPVGRAACMLSLLSI